MTELELEDELSAPTPELVAALGRIPGDILIAGAGGKMGPSLARLAVRASTAAGVSRRTIAVARFSNPPVRDLLDRSGVETIACDLFDRAAVDQLPDAANVIYMAGRKFGTATDAAATWATNAFLPGTIADRFAAARIVAFSTGNVYPVSAVGTRGPAETAAIGPVGEYAAAALGRERVLEFFSRRNHTPMAILRLNYAVEPRYGVLRDIADRVHTRQPVDLAMAKVNVIWQRDANAIALRVLEHCATPPLVLNVTGSTALSVRDIAAELGRRLGVPPEFAGVEGSTALLSDARLCESMFGPAPVGISEMLDRVAAWVASGGRSLGLPTHFQERGGQF